MHVDESPLFWSWRHHFLSPNRFWVANLKDDRMTCERSGVEMQKCQPRFFETKIWQTNIETPKRTVFITQKNGKAWVSSRDSRLGSSTKNGFHHPKNSVDGRNPPIIYRVLNIPGGAGFLPSTVFQTQQIGLQIFVRVLLGPYKAPALTEPRPVRILRAIFTTFSSTVMLTAAMCLGLKRL